MKKLVVIFFILAIVFVTGCFSNHEYAIDYQEPNVFMYAITASTKGLGDKVVVFTNNLRGAITDASFYSAVTMKVKVYDYDTNALGAPIATLLPVLNGDKLICATNEAQEPNLKLCKQVLIRIEATRGNKTAVILEKVVYNGMTHSGKQEIEIDFFSFTESLIYKAWVKLYPTMDYGDFIYNLEKSNPYTDLAVIGVKEAIAEWNNLEYLDLDYKLAEPNSIATQIAANKCYNLYCQKIPELTNKGIFAGIKTEDIDVQVLGHDNKVIIQKPLEKDGSFTFSLPEKNAYYNIKVRSDYTNSWLATGVIGAVNAFNADYLLYEKDFVVR